MSILCPTFGRSAHLRNLVGYYCEQKYAGAMQLLILDDSPEPSVFLEDPALRERGVHYLHLPALRMTIGAKLNMLSELAAGDIVMRFDDDDYYAPDYVEAMVDFLGNNDIFTLSRWFAYSHRSDAFCYWATDRWGPAHYVVSPAHPIRRLSTEEMSPDITTEWLKGYGFSAVWRRSIFPTVRFPDINHREDLLFFLRAEEAGFRSGYAPDEEGIVLHQINESNTACIYPQYLLPDSLRYRHFPHFPWPAAPELPKHL